MLKRTLLWILALLGPAVAAAQDVVKVGIVAPFSGPFAVYGQQFQRGAELYLEEIGGRAGNTKIELILRDESGGPERVRQITQELIVRDGAQILGGYVFTPSALAIAPLVTQSKMPTVIFNAATGMVTRRSPYFARVSMSSWQGSYTIAEWAARNGVKEAFVAVSDYAPGHDSRDGFKAAFVKGGGKVVGEMLIPVSTTDFGPFMQRIRDSKPGAVYVFMPVGPPSVAFVKTFHSYGLGSAGVRLLGTGETDELELAAIGEQALGMITSYHYSPYLDNPENKRYVAAFKKKFGATAITNFASTAGYDGMHAIADVVAKLGA
ncbi:MAG: ABC transporter substrate-binding protein, partial [Betaproteobacteria bacterium]|nr:ABC transporter substrate-binding protein [Betaproteobacteria bacterium]